MKFLETSYTYRYVDSTTLDREPEFFVGKVKEGNHIRRRRLDLKMERGGGGGGGYMIVRDGRSGGGNNDDDVVDGGGGGGGSNGYDEYVDDDVVMMMIMMMIFTMMVGGGGGGSGSDSDGDGDDEVVDNDVVMMIMLMLIMISKMMMFILPFQGHAAPILYAAWAEAGLFPVSELAKLRSIDSDLEGHPTPVSTLHLLIYLI